MLEVNDFPEFNLKISVREMHPLPYERTDEQIVYKHKSYPRMKKEHFYRLQE